MLYECSTPRGGYGRGCVHSRTECEAEDNNEQNTQFKQAFLSIKAGENFLHVHEWWLLLRGGGQPASATKMNPGCGLKASPKQLYLGNIYVHLVTFKLLASLSICHQFGVHRFDKESYLPRRALDHCRKLKTAGSKTT